MDDLPISKIMINLMALVLRQNTDVTLTELSIKSINQKCTKKD